VPYADDVNLLREDIDTVNENRETLIDAGEDDGLEINVGET
jgi:hypothetical protein